MASEQRGGGIESNHRQVRPNSEAEPLSENDTKSKIVITTEQSEQTNFDDKIGQLPRRYSTPSAANAQPTPLSRNPSNCSAMSVQVTTESEVHFSSTSTSSSRRPPQPQPPQPSRQSHQYQTLEPPVTKATLSELDVNKILMNPKLRHDINFDPELHFRPNMDGVKGRKKNEKANQFWSALLEQLALFVADRPAFVVAHGGRGEWCLPLLLRAAKEIIQTLVPVRDRAYLDEGLDVELLMQQFDKGTADLEKLALWLSGVLKSHCAPMRDDWVDEMYSQLSSGNRSNDLPELVKGMRSLLSVLEAMKLDVANHQIRCLRPVLIEDTVHFEQKYHAKRMGQSRTRMDTTEAIAWYQAEMTRFSGSRSSKHDFGEMAIFFEALGRLMMPSVESSRISRLQVFQFDEDRISKLRADILDAINIEVCMRTWEELEGRCRQQQQQQQQHQHQQQNDSPFSSSLSLPISDEDRTVLSWSQEMSLNYNSLLQAPSRNSRPSSIVYSDAGSMDSSPRSSVVFTPPLTGFTTDLSKARTLYHSLLALAHTAPTVASHTSRWQSLAPDMALQILRSTSASLDLLPALESELASHVCDATSNLFQEVEAEFHTRLMVELSRRVSELKGLTAVNIFSVATGGRVPGHGHVRAWESNEPSLGRLGGSSALREPRDEAGMEDMATRVAHLGILHWRVWSGILYSPYAETTPSAATPAM